MDSTSTPRLDTDLTLTRARLADDLRLPEQHLADCGITDVHVPTPAIRVPYFGPSGTEIAARLITSLTNDRANRWVGNVRPKLEGLDRLADAQKLGRLTIAMGEPSSWVLSYYGESVVSLQNPNVWDDDRDGSLLAMIPHIDLVVSDADRDALLDRFSRSRLRQQIHIIDLGADSIVDLHRSDPDAFPTRWAELRRTGLTLDDLEHADLEHDRTEAYEMAKELLHAPDLLERFQQAFATLGWAGDPTPPLLAYIGLTSRLLERPMILVFVSPSGMGKSFAVDVAVELMPSEAVFQASATSPLALVYSDAEFRHRVIYLREADSLPEEGPAAAAMRSVISENRLAYDVPEMDPTTGRRVTRRIEKPGPTGFVSTFTRPLTTQYNTRALQLPIDQSPEQTKRIMRAFAKRAAGLNEPVPNLDELLAFQRYLELSGVHQVRVPFAECLADLIPAISSRLRRDFVQLITVIQTLALLRVCQRDRADNGSLLATIDDYADARDLLAGHFARTSADGLTRAVRETVLAVKPGEQLTISELQARLGLKSVASAHERVRKAIKGGWLLNRQTRRSQPAIIVRGAPLPDEGSILPTVEQLEERFGVSGPIPGSTPPPPSPAGEDDKHQAGDVP